MDLRRASIHLYCIDDFLHDFGMIAVMDARLFHAQVRMRLHRDSLLRIIWHHILINIVFREQLAVHRVTQKPQPGGLVVEVVGYAQVVGPVSMNRVFRLVHYHVFIRCKHIVCLLKLFGDIINVNCFLIFRLIILQVINVDEICAPEIL